MAPYEILSNEAGTFIFIQGAFRSRSTFYEPIHHRDVWVAAGAVASVLVRAELVSYTALDANSMPSFIYYIPRIPGPRSPLVVAESRIRV